MAVFMEPLAAVLFSFLSICRASIARLCLAACSGLRVTMIFPGNGSLSTTHAQDLERCQPGLHNKELTSPCPKLCGTQVTLGMHAISEAIHFLQALPAPVASINPELCVYAGSSGQFSGHCPPATAKLYMLCSQHLERTRRHPAPGGCHH